VVASAHRSNRFAAQRKAERGTDMALSKARRADSRIVSKEANLAFVLSGTLGTRRGVFQRLLYSFCLLLHRFSPRAAVS
jgi:hypothetical protein